MSLARSGRWINLRVIGRERAAFHREAQPELPKPTIYPRQKCLAKASPKAHVSPGRGLISAWRGTAIRRAGSMACCRNSCSTRRVRLLGNALSAGKDRRYEPPVSFVPRPPISPRQRCLAWATPRQRCLAWATPVSQTKVPGLGNGLGNAWARPPLIGLLRVRVGMLGTKEFVPGDAGYPPARSTSSGRSCLLAAWTLPDDTLTSLSPSQVQPAASRQQISSPIVTATSSCPSVIGDPLPPGTIMHGFHRPEPTTAFEVNKVIEPVRQRKLRTHRGSRFGCGRSWVAPSLSSKGPHGDLRLKDADWIMEGVT